MDLSKWYIQANLLRRLSNSPSTMTAAAIAARAFALFAPVPFLAVHFSDSVVALWLVFLTFQSLVAAINGTLPAVFLNMVAYAAAGSRSLGGVHTRRNEALESQPNWPLLHQLCRLLLNVFASIAILWIFVSSTVGVFVVSDPISRTDLAGEAWLAWAIFVVGSSARILQQGHIAYCLGCGQVAAARLLEAASWTVGGIAAVLSLLVAPSFLLAMVLLQVPLMVNLVAMAGLAKRFGWSRAPRASKGEHLFFREVVPRAWRGSVGTFASIGAIYGSGLFYAQVGSSSEVAGYLFALSVIGIIGAIATSPLASAVPVLAGHWAKGKSEDLSRLAASRIALSMALYSGLTVLVPLVVLIGSRFVPEGLPFVPMNTWIAMVFAVALYRYGALHLQVYTVTNDIRWHVVDTINSALFIVLLVIFFDGRVIVFPFSQGIAVLLFYLPYSRFLTHRKFDFSLKMDLPKVCLSIFVAVISLYAISGFV